MARDKALQLANNVAVTANAIIGAIKDFGAASNVIDDVFYTIRGKFTTAGNVVIQGSKTGTFTDAVVLVTVPVTTATTKVVSRLPAFGVPRFIRAYSTGAVGTGVSIDATIGVSVMQRERASAPFVNGANGDPIQG